METNNWVRKSNFIKANKIAKEITLLKWKTKVEKYYAIIDILKKYIDTDDWIVENRNKTTTAFEWIRPISTQPPATLADVK